MPDTGPLTDHDIAMVLVSRFEQGMIYRACRELADLRRIRATLETIISDDTLTSGELRKQLAELVS